MSKEFRKYDVPNSLANVKPGAYRRSITGSLFAISAIAGGVLLLLTFGVFFQNWRNFSGNPIDPPRAFPMYWITVAVLVLTTVGMVWSVRAEYRDGRGYVTGLVFIGLSLVPLILGIAMLAVTP